MRKRILAFSLSMLFFASISTVTFAANRMDDNKDKAKTTTTAKKSDKSDACKTEKSCTPEGKSCCSASKSAKTTTTTTDGADKK